MAPGGRGGTGSLTFAGPIEQREYGSTAETRPPSGSRGPGIEGGRAAPLPPRPQPSLTSGCPDTFSPGGRGTPRKRRGRRPGRALSSGPRGGWGDRGPTSPDGASRQARHGARLPLGSSLTWPDWSAQQSLESTMGPRDLKADQRSSAGLNTAAAAGAAAAPAEREAPPGAGRGSASASAPPPPPPRTPFPPALAPARPLQAARGTAEGEPRGPQARGPRARPVFRR